MNPNLRYHRGVDTAGILVIGNEVLSGKVEEANARFLIGALRSAGVRLERVVYVRDEIPAVAAEVADMARRFDHLFTAGGVGGTHDDVTMPAVAEALGVPLETHPKLLSLLEAHYRERMTPAHHRIAKLPTGAELLVSDGSPIPVVRVRNIFVLPGVPRLLRAKFPAIEPHLRGRPVYLAELFLAVEEEAVAELLAAADQIHPAVEVGSYPRFELDLDHRVKITVEGPRSDFVEEVFRYVLDRLGSDELVRTEPVRLVGGRG